MDVYVIKSVVRFEDGSEDNLTIGVFTPWGKVLQYVAEQGFELRKVSPHEWVSNSKESLMRYAGTYGTETLYVTRYELQTW